MGHLNTGFESRVRELQVRRQRANPTASGTIDTAPHRAGVVGRVVFATCRSPAVAVMTANRSLIKAMSEWISNAKLQQRFRAAPQGFTARHGRVAHGCSGKSRRLVSLLGGTPRSIPAYNSLGMGGTAGREIENR
ncbi:MAG: hypothetical protein IPG33_02055 [Betaproteobacteria bacterium]|nr:hypothetical protein [Betaproteobacteria bacterium]